MSRKHKKHDDHENHERWLVSYADFITLLFAFFVVMYAISSVNEGKYRVLSDSLVSAFQKAPRSTLPIPVGKEAPSPNPASANLIKHTLPVRKGDAAQDAQRKQQEAKMKNIAKDIGRRVDQGADRGGKGPRTGGKRHSGGRLQR